MFDAGPESPGPPPPPPGSQPLDLWSNHMPMDSHGTDIAYKFPGIYCGWESPLMGSTVLYMMQGLIWLYYSSIYSSIVRVLDE